MYRIYRKKVNSKVVFESNGGQFTYTRKFNNNEVSLNKTISLYKILTVVIS